MYYTSLLTFLINFAVKVDRACCLKSGFNINSGNSEQLLAHPCEKELINHSALSTCDRIKAQKPSNFGARAKHRCDLSGLLAKEMSQCG